jgi:predicted small secreted protein
VKNILIVLALSCGLFVSACNTVRGAGEDAKSVGECVDGRKGNC